MERDKVYRYWMHNLPGIGDRTIEKLLKEFGCAENVYRARNHLPQQFVKKNTAEKIKEFTKTWEMEREYTKMQQKGIKFYSLEDEEYPARLRKLIHPPYALYCMGSMPEEERPSVAIIGARECSEYGRYMAEAFAGKMADAGVSIISGMARGIDGIGQRAAVEKKGRTYAVLGSGVDVCYPASNKALYRDIQDTGGGILSVFPPGTSPQKAQFPERNRIVAGLADVILVVEARAKSGTWITVDMALEQGKNIYAVPGRLTDRLSDGCNLLIRQGAGIALTPEDILAELAVLTNRKGTKNKQSRGRKKKEHKGDMDIAGFLDFNPKPAEEILKEITDAGMSMELPDLLAELIGLCVEGRAKQVTGSHFVKVHER
ncbi:MAG: DNA-processing protein DprA [Lachnospiraceae bacterium]|nr:DNA-processing protein DprA [Lachnospiraceae bacterium]MDE6185138.1 DNA-processing protein DprA [Lachnospiraceae bacterium]